MIAFAGGQEVIRAAGLTATRYRIVQADDGTTVSIGPITTGITNTGALRYKATASMPAVAGDYEIQWDDGSGTWAATEDLTIHGSSAALPQNSLKPPS